MGNMSFDPLKPHNRLKKLPPPKEVLESPAVLKKTISASRALANLAAGKALPNQTVLLHSVFLREAKQSSEIENIVTTDDELYEALADIEKDVGANTKEVLYYVEALWKGVEWIKRRPLTTNAFIDIVQIVKGNSAGVRRTTGTNLKNKSTGEVVYTPPEGEELLNDLLKNLEEFMHKEKDIDPLIKMAIAHYQFEAIHPFGDGNGRTGRILNILFLLEAKLLETPILYLSRYIINNKDDYYRYLLEVTTENKWEQWILYMLDAVEQTAIYTDGKIEEILKVMDDTCETMKEKVKFYTKELLEVLFQQPYCKAKFLVDAGIAKEQTARKYLEDLVEIGVLDSIKIGRENLYINKEFLRVLKG